MYSAPYKYLLTELMNFLPVHCRVVSKVNAKFMMIKAMYFSLLSNVNMYMYIAVFDDISFVKSM